MGGPRTPTQHVLAVMAAQPPRPTASEWDQAVADALGWRHRDSVANARRRLGVRPAVEPTLACRWCKATMDRDYALRCCSRLCRACSAEAGREWMR